MTGNSHKTGETSLGKNWNGYCARLLRKCCEIVRKLYCERVLKCQNNVLWQKMCRENVMVRKFSAHFRKIVGNGQEFWGSCLERVGKNSVIFRTLSEIASNLLVKFAKIVVELVCKVSKKLPGNCNEDVAIYRDIVENISEVVVKLLQKY